MKPSVSTASLLPCRAAGASMVAPPLHASYAERGGLQSSGSSRTSGLAERKPQARRRNHGVGARRNAERGKDGMRMLLDRCRRDRELGGDALVVVSLEDQAQHVLLALREIEIGPFHATLERLRRNIGAARR